MTKGTQKRKKKGAPGGKPPKQTQNATKVIYEAPESSLIIKPTFNARQANAMKGAGGGNPKFLSALNSEQGRFELSLVRHLFDRSHQFPLPSVPFEGVARVIGRKLGFPTATDTIPHFYTELGTSTGNVALSTVSMQVQDDRALSSQYGNFSGRVNGSSPIHVDANGSARVLVTFDPTCYDYPVVILQSTPTVLPGWTSSSGLKWLCNPYPLHAAGNFVSSGFQAREKEKEKRFKDYEEVGAISITSPTVGDDGFIYPGGYCVDVYVENLTAYTASSIRVRDEHDAVHTFGNLLKWSNSADNSANNFGILRNYERTNSATAWYSGSCWTFAKSNTDLSTNLIGTCLQRVQSALANGYPMFDIILTNSGAVGTDIQLSISAVGWSGTAPTDPTVAGSMPLETVPFSVPSWFSLGRCLSSLGGVNGLSRAFQAMPGPLREAVASPGVLTRAQASALLGSDDFENYLISEEKKSSGKSKLDFDTLLGYAQTARRSLNTPVGSRISNGLMNVLSQTARSYFNSGMPGARLLRNEINYP